MSTKASPQTQTRGFVDGIFGNHLCGWAVNPFDFTRRPKVVIVIDGAVVAEKTANDMREDVLKLGIGDGNHGFKYLIPPPLLDGEQHEVAIFDSLTNKAIPPGAIRLKFPERPAWSRNDLRYFALYPDVLDACRSGRLLSAVDHYRVNGANEDRTAPTSISVAGAIDLVAETSSNFLGGEVVRFQHNKGHVTLTSWMSFSLDCKPEIICLVDGDKIQAQVTAESLSDRRCKWVFATHEFPISDLDDVNTVSLLVIDRSGLELARWSPPASIIGNATVHILDTLGSLRLSGWIKGELSAFAFELVAGRQRIQLSPILASPPPPDFPRLSSDSRSYWIEDLMAEVLPAGEHELTISVHDRRNGNSRTWGPASAHIDRAPLAPPPPKLVVAPLHLLKFSIGILDRAQAPEDWTNRLPPENLLGVFSSVQDALSAWSAKRPTGLLIIAALNETLPPDYDLLSDAKKFISDPRRPDFAVPLPSNEWTSTPPLLLCRGDVVKRLHECNALDRQEMSPTSLARQLNHMPLTVTQRDPPLILNVESKQKGVSPQAFLSIEGWVSTSEVEEPVLRLGSTNRQVPCKVSRHHRPDVALAHPDHVQSLPQAFKLVCSWIDLPPGCHELDLVAETSSHRSSVAIGMLDIPCIQFFVEETLAVRQENTFEIVVRGWAASLDSSPILIELQEGTSRKKLSVEWTIREDVSEHIGLAPSSLLAFTATGLSTFEALDDSRLHLSCALGTVTTEKLTFPILDDKLAWSVSQVLWVGGRPHLRINGWATTPMQDADSVELTVNGALICKARPCRPVVISDSNSAHFALRDYCGFELDVDMSDSSGRDLTAEIAARINGVVTKMTTIPLRVPDRSTSQSLSGNLDTPIDGFFVAAEDSITVVGWAISANRHSIEIDCYLNDQIAATVSTTLRRSDVVQSLDLPMDATPGFRCLIPTKLPAGQQARIRVVVRDLDTNDELDLGVRTINIATSTPFSRQRLARWLSSNAITARSAKDAWEAATAFRLNPRVSILMPHYRARPEHLEQAVESVARQWYTNFELCIADDQSGDTKYRAHLEALTAKYDWIRLIFCKENGGIAWATNRASDLATGDFILLLDQDDRLSENCLFEFAKYYNDHPTSDVVYSDTDKIDDFGRRRDPHFKPDFSSATLLSYMYMNHALFIRRSLFERVGRFRLGFDGAQDHDLALRVVESAKHIGHIPTILYHWRVHAGSTALSGNEKPASFDAGARAVADALRRRGQSFASVKRPEFAIGAGAGYYQVDWKVIGQPLVSIIIPTRDQLPILKRCLASLNEKTAYTNFEIIIVDDRSVEPKTRRYLAKCPHRVIRVKDSGQGFNFSNLINRGAAASKGRYVVVLNNDTEIISPDWLESMLGWAQQKSVGVVGCRLLFPGSDFIQHAGLTLRLDGASPGHLFRGEASFSGGYYGWAKIARNCSAVTFAAAMIRRDVFEKLGGLDEDGFPHAYQDPDFCLRAIRAGYQVIYCPAAELIHHESLSKPRHFKDAADRAEFQLRWPHPDPFFNPNLVGAGDAPALIDRRTLLTNPRSKVRVAALVHSALLQGAPQSQLITLRGLVERHGFELHVIFCDRAKPQQTAYAEFATSIEEISYGRTHSREQQLSDLLGRIQPDLVYCNTLETYWCIAVAEHDGFATFWNIRESAAPARFFGRNPSATSKALACLSRAGRLGFVAESTARLFRESAPELGPSVVIPNGLDLAAFFPAARRTWRALEHDQAQPSKQSLIFGTVGTLCSRKAQHLALRAFIELQRRLPTLDAWFVSVGAAGRKDYLKLIESVKSSSPKPDRILVLPEDRNICRWYQSFDIFVTATLEESFPRIIIEAMACGLPVIATSVFGIVEQVIDKRTGVLVEVGDVDAMADAMQELATDRPRRLQMGKLGRRIAESAFSQEAMIDAYAREFRLLREESGVK